MSPPAGVGEPRRSLTLIRTASGGNSPLNSRPWKTPGVKLTAFELGNEFNTVGYNADFPAQSSGRVLGLNDLNNPNDAEARQIAAGYLQYIKIMAVVKDVRDHSRLNKTTPIITGGLANVGLPGPKSFDNQLATSVADTITFLRQHGIDQFVDGFGVHAYTSGDPHQTMAQRVAVLEIDLPRLHIGKAVLADRMGLQQSRSVLSDP